MANEFPLSLIVRAVDRATGPLRKIAAVVDKVNAPIAEFSKRLGNSLTALSGTAGLPKLAAGFKGLGEPLVNVKNAAVDLGQKLLTIAGVGGLALYSIIRGAVDAGDKLGEMADRVGLSVDAYASLAHAADLADVEQEQFNAGMDKFNKNLGEAKAGGGSLLEFLKKVSPTLAKQIVAVKSTEEGLSLMTDAFARIPDPQRRAALSGAAFGKSNLQMGNFLHQGSAAIQKQQTEFMRLAGSQEAFARGAGDLDNAIRNAGTAFAGLRAVAAGSLFPALTKLTGVATEFIVANRDGISKWASDAAASISKWVDGGGIGRLVAGIQDLAQNVSSFVDRIGGAKGVLVALGVYMAGPLIAAILGTIPAVYALGVALLTTPVGWFLLSVAAIAAAAALVITNWGAVSAFFKEFFPGFSKDVDQAVGGLKQLAQWGSKLLDIWEAFKNRQAIRSGDLMSGPRSDLDNAVMDSWNNSITGKIMNVLHTTDFERPIFGAESARPRAAPAGNITVDFNNAPPGTRVTTDAGRGQSIDTSVGYSMDGG